MFTSKYIKDTEGTFVFQHSRLPFKMYLKRSAINRENKKPLIRDRFS